MEEKAATYIGPERTAEGDDWNIVVGDKVLLAESRVPGMVRVQFDDFSKKRDGVEVAYGWHTFPKEHFKVEEQ